MFSKDNSSLVSADSGKKGKDVPLRKSDRRHLRQRVQQTLYGNNEDSNNDSNNDNNNKCNNILDAAFLQGTLLARTLHLANQERAVLYIRNPNTKDKDTSDSNDNNTCESSSSSSSSSSSFSWPYTTTCQVVWIEIFHRGPNDSSGVPSSQVPTLALLGVLGAWSLLSFIKNNNNSNNVTVVTIPPLVSKYLCRGAHLMKSGVLDMDPLPRQESPLSSSSSLSSWQQQDARRWLALVQIAGNPQPVAVGWLHDSLFLSPQQQQSAAASAPIFGPGTKGLAVHIVTAYGDDLWKQQQVQPTTSPSSSSSSLSGPVSPLGGAPFNAGHYGNIGFCQGQYAVPITTMKTTTTITSDETSSSPPPPQQQQQEEGWEDTTTTTATNTTGVDDVAEDNHDNKHQTNDNSPTGKTQVHQTLQEKEQDAQPQEKEAVPPLSPDDILHQAVCRALVRLSPKADLPLAVSVFYAQHVLPNRPAGTTIQLKQTKYKKFGAYLTEQVQRNLLQVGPDAAKKDPLAVLTSYNSRHEDLQDFVSAARQEKQQAVASSQTTTTNRRRMVLLDLYVIPSHWVPLLRLDTDVVKAAHATSTERRNTGYLTAKECKAILENYITRENLVHPVQQSNIVLDGPLTDVLFKTKKGGGKTPNENETSALPTQVTRKDLAVVWQAKMERAFALVQMPGSHIVSMGRGKGPLVTMEVSKRQNKKFVTRVRGMEHFGIAAGDLQHEISHRFACAASVEENPHEKLKKGHVELILQGNLADQVEALLIGDESLTSHGGAKDSPYSIPKNAVEVVLRKGVPARKGRVAAGKKK